MYLFSCVHLPLPSGGGACATVQESSEITKLFLLLNAMKEMILEHTKTRASRNEFLQQNVLPIVMHAVLVHADASHENVRTSVAESLGALAAINGQAVLQTIRRAIEQHASSASASSPPSSPASSSVNASSAPSKSGNVRATMVAALRFALTPSFSETSLLRSLLHETLPLLCSDPDLAVRRQALVTVNAIVHAYPLLLDGELLRKSLLPVLYKATKPDPSLVVELEMGPFKHNIDKGLPLRKAAYQCLATLLRSCHQYLNLNDFALCIKDSFLDHIDIQTVGFELLALLPTLSSDATTAALTSSGSASLSSLPEGMHPLVFVLDEFVPIFKTVIKNNMTLSQRKPSNADGSEQTPLEKAQVCLFYLFRFCSRH